MKATQYAEIEAALRLYRAALARWGKDHPHTRRRLIRLQELREQHSKTLTQSYQS